MKLDFDSITQEQVTYVDEKLIPVLSEGCTLKTSVGDFELSSDICSVFGALLKGMITMHSHQQGDSQYE